MRFPYYYSIPFAFKRVAITFILVELILNEEEGAFEDWYH